MFLRFRSHLLVLIKWSIRRIIEIISLEKTFQKNPINSPSAVTRIAKEDKFKLMVERAMTKLINNIIDRKLFINSVCSEGRVYGNF